jgi:hypothetical protein
MAWRFTGHGVEQGGDDQTLLCSSNDVTGPPPVWIDGPPAVWIGLEGSSLRVAIRLQVAPGAGVETWTGPTLHPGGSFDFQVAVHTGMGPGGVMYRGSEDSEWSTMRSSSARGADLLVWPERWLLGHGRSGARDLPFVGANLRANWHREDLEIRD